MLTIVFCRLFCKIIEIIRLFFIAFAFTHVCFINLQKSALSLAMKNIQNIPTIYCFLGRCLLIDSQVRFEFKKDRCFKNFNKELFKINLCENLLNIGNSFDVFMTLSRTRWIVMPFWKRKTSTLIITNPWQKTYVRKLWPDPACDLTFSWTFRRKLKLITLAIYTLKILQTAKGSGLLWSLFYR